MTDLDDYLNQIHSSLHNSLNLIIHHNLNLRTRHEDHLNYSLNLIIHHDPIVLIVLDENLN